MAEEHPLVVVIRRDATVTTRIVIRNVEYTCKVTGGTTKAVLEIVYTTRGAALEYRSLEAWAKKLAQSKPWTAEDLAIEVSKRLADLVNRHAERPRDARYIVTVRLSFQETSDTMVTVEAVAP